MTTAAAHDASYKLIAHLPRPENGWWNDYCTPLNLVQPHEDMPFASESGTAMTTWTTRPETVDDIPTIRDINLHAFPTSEEADIIDSLRADPDAWIDELSLMAVTPGGDPVGYALLTRCYVGDDPALTLGPCAVLPSVQRTGAGSAAIQAALNSARARGEKLILVLGHADYYPRFGFERASTFGITAPFEVPDEAMMAMVLDEAHAAPSGTIRYPAAFGV